VENRYIAVAQGVLYDYVKYFSAIPCAKTTWKSSGKTVAGSNEAGDALNQLNSAYGVFVDSDNALFVTDYSNHRVVKWNQGAAYGTLLAGGQCGAIEQGQLCNPSAITFDKEGTMYVTVQDDRKGSGSVIRWNKGATSGETLIMANTSFYGITLDAKEEYLYVGHHREHRVVKYTKGGKFVSVVAGGNDRGATLKQLDYRKYAKRWSI
jgi:sugar lactone lactonase YvrE